MNYSPDTLKTIFSSSPIGIYMVRNNRFIFSNPKFKEISGYSEEDLTTFHPLDIVAPEYRDQVRENAVKMLKGQKTKPHEFMVISKSGQKRWILESVSSIMSGENRAVLGHFMDITDARKAENELIASEVRYRSFFELAREGILLVDYDTGAIVDSNVEFQRQTGYSLQELQSQNIWELQPENLREEAKKSFFRFKEHRGGLISWNLLENRNNKMLPVEIIAQKLKILDRQTICA
ncbi:hypothetical protein MTBBW1_1280016 [Desulfamplus magnetovallimortis]|uniref:histidine kinase n=1 Tax=Desulfamplus magnetovallimortis TaxID=1246637 RepID=A0A1W1H6X0_9BACT|nr:PAS domain S-box protein [Desulfamplus magnetovallimortis]SLM28213.1 hypothetical protein MTBBW1_1280016 [Desulfamplus magnetovallimortis]